MKKSILISVFLLIAVTVFCQADTTAVGVLTGFGLSKTVSWLIITALGLVVGHFVVPQKWASILAIIQKVLEGLVALLNWFNDKTNKLSRSQKLAKMMEDGK